jgi:hypothetical protein
MCIPFAALVKIKNPQNGKKTESAEHFSVKDRTTGKRTSGFAVLM